MRRIRKAHYKETKRLLVSVILKEAEQIIADKMTNKEYDNTFRKKTIDTAIVKEAVIEAYMNDKVLQIDNIPDKDIKDYDKLYDNFIDSENDEEKKKIKEEALSKEHGQTWLKYHV